MSTYLARRWPADRRAYFAERGMIDDPGDDAQVLAFAMRLQDADIARQWHRGHPRGSCCPPPAWRFVPVAELDSTGDKWLMHGDDGQPLAPTPPSELAAQARARADAEAEQGALW